MNTDRTPLTTRRPARWLATAALIGLLAAGCGAAGTSAPGPLDETLDEAAAAGSPLVPADFPRTPDAAYPAGAQRSPDATEARQRAQA